MGPSPRRRASSATGGLPTRCTTTLKCFAWPASPKAATRSITSSRWRSSAGFWKPTKAYSEGDNDAEQWNNRHGTEPAGPAAGTQDPAGAHAPGDAARGRRRRRCDHDRGYPVALDGDMDRIARGWWRAEQRAGRLGSAAVA